MSEVISGYQQIVALIVEASKKQNATEGMQFYNEHCVPIRASFESALSDLEREFLNSMTRVLWNVWNAWLESPEALQEQWSELKEGYRTLSEITIRLEDAFTQLFGVVEDHHLPRAPLKAFVRFVKNEERFSQWTIAEILQHAEMRVRDMKGNKYNEQSLRSKLSLPPDELNIKLLTPQQLKRYERETKELRSYWRDETPPPAPIEKLTRLLDVIGNHESQKTGNEK